MAKTCSKSTKGKKAKSSAKTGQQAPSLPPTDSKSARLICLRCSERKSWLFKGPDGQSTLCNHCFVLYRDKKLTLYQSQDGKVSVRSSRKARPAEIVAFNTDGTTISYDLPIVRLISDASGKPATSTAPAKEESTDDVISISSNSEDDADRDDFTGEIRASRDPPGRTRKRPVEDSNQKQEDRAALNRTETATTESSRMAAQSSSPSREPRSKKKRKGLKRTRSVCAQESSVRKGGSNSVVQLHGVNSGRIEKSSSAAPLNSIHLEKRRWIVHIKASFVSASSRLPSRRFTIPYKTPFAALKNDLKQMFQIQTDFRVSYKDNDDDDIAVTSDNELLELFAVSRMYSIFPVMMSVQPC